MFEKILNMPLYKAFLYLRGSKRQYVKSLDKPFIYISDIWKSVIVQIFGPNAINICDKKQPTSLFQQNIFSDNFGKSSEKYRLSKEVWV